MIEREDALPSGVETLIERARELTDEDRLALAAARGKREEGFHAGAWRRANDIVARRAQTYIEARHQVALAFLPDRLEELVQMGPEADPEEVRRWREVALLARAGIDDALMALVAGDTIRPPDFRELYEPWKEMLTAAHERRAPRDSA